MADRKPLKLSGGIPAQYETGDTLAIDHGGTGATTAPAARYNLGLEIGVDVQAYNPNLDKASLLTTAGFATRLANGNWVTRKITGTAGNISVGNDDGASNDAVIDLVNVGNTNSGSFLKVNIDSKGRIVGSTAVTTADIGTLVDTRYVRTDTVSTLNNGVTIRYNAGTTMTNPNDLATVQFVQDVASGGNPPWDSVRICSDSNVTASGTQTIQGIALTSGMRVLLKGQTNSALNGIYVVAAGVWSRATDADESTDFTPGRTVFVEDGDFIGSSWAYNGISNPTIGTTAITFTQNSSGAVSVNGGLIKLGTAISVGTASVTRIVVNSNDIDLATVANSGTGTFIKVNVDAYGRVVGTVPVAWADISPLLSANLSGLSNLNTTGVMVKTGSGTYATREIQGTTGRVSVTNGTGGTNNPITVDLAASGVTAGTYNSVTVDTYGRVTGGTVSSAKLNNSNLQNGEASAIAIGKIVYVSGNGVVKLANANSSGTCNAIGFVSQTSISASATGSIANSGYLEATTNQWDAVTSQSGGLTPGATYYLSNTVNGGMTTSPPATGYIKMVGVAASTTELSIQFGQLIKL